MFKAPEYWFKIIFELMIKNGNLNLLSDYLIVGLGGGFNTLHKGLEKPDNITGTAHVVRAYTGYYKNVKLSTIAIAGGGVYAEWIIGLAYARKIKALIGIGWCGALSNNISIGDIVIPIAAVRDEDTTDHHVSKNYPAISNFKLTYKLYEILKEILRNTNIKVHEGIILTTSSTLTENPEWGKKWSKYNVIAVDGETSIIYTLASIAKIPAVNILTVSDHVVKPKIIDKQLGEKINKTHQLTIKAAYETLFKIAQSNEAK